MIRQLKIQNFKSHQNSTMDFHPGLNTITGESYEGKSVIVKAIVWAAKNHPSGFNFKSHFSKDKDETIVEITTDENKIKRLRSKSKNNYVLNDDEKHPFEALRKDIPNEIKQTLNISDINIHGQFDKFFLLQETSGEVGRQLNELVGLQIIDRTQKNIDSMSRENNSEIRQNKKQIEEKKQRLESLKWVDDAEKHVEKIDRLISRIDDLKIKQKDLAGIVKKSTELIKNIKQYDCIVLLETNIKTLLILEEKEKKFIIKIKNIATIIYKIKTEQKNDFSIIDFESDVKKIIDLKNKLKEKIDVISDIRNYIDQIVATSKSILLQDLKINKLQEQFNSELAKNKICPLCKGKLK